MSDTSIGLSDYVKYILRSDIAPPLTINEPEGWSEDNFELNRHDDYHGIFYNISGALSFRGEAKEYCETAYRIGGINTNLWIRKIALTNVDSDIKWRERYNFKADFNTRSIKDGALQLSFSTNDLAEILKSHESDEFEIERVDSIDGVILDELKLNSVELAGRDILETGESIAAVKGGGYSGFKRACTIPTTVVSIGPVRHSMVNDDDFIYPASGNVITNLNGGNLFYGHTDAVDTEHTINGRYEFKVFARNIDADGTLIGKLVKVQFRQNTADFIIIEEITILNAPIVHLTQTYESSGTFTFSVKADEGLMLVYYGFTGFSWDKQNIWLNRVTFFEKSPDIKFIFTHDLIERLMYILTGRPDAFYSKMLGRVGIKDYVQDGEAGLLGNVSGFYARAFVKGSEKYKSLKISPKDVFESTKALLNVGIGIETVNFKERVRIEDLKYFYRSEVVVKLPYTISDVERKTDSSLFFSGLTFGYDKSRDYEGTMGLDEPNIKVDWVTPIRKSSNKFVKTSKIRADDYGLEIARRKPQSLFGNEDTKYDDVNWWLDLKRTVGTSFAQKDYTDRSQDDFLPQHIFSPETFKGLFFTPLAMLFRHAWIFRAGLEPYLDRYLKYISSTANSKLVTWREGDTKSRAEDEDILISEIGRSRMLPEIITCKHPAGDDLMAWIIGTTKAEVNGMIEDVPNYYFKFEFKNEDGEVERGYLMNLKQGDNSTFTFTFQKANENLI